MGVDISGINPIIRSNEPVIDFQNASDDAKNIYFEERGKWNNENPGVYFRASWWSWRPILIFIESVISKHNLKLSTENWGFNDGAGLKTQEECDLLAEYLKKELVNIQETMQLEDDDQMSVNLGSWVSIDGSFIDEKTTDTLNNNYPQGSVLLTSIITENGTPVQPAHSVDIGHIKEFITFLGECGGFQIY